MQNGTDTNCASFSQCMLLDRIEELATTNGDARARIGSLEAQLVVSREASSAAIAHLEDRLVASQQETVSTHELCAMLFDMWVCASCLPTVAARLLGKKKSVTKCGIGSTCVSALLSLPAWHSIRLPIIYSRYNLAVMQANAMRQLQELQVSSSA
jgi:hypothetical protein